MKDKSNLAGKSGDSAAESAADSRAEEYVADQTTQQGAPDPGLVKMTNGDVFLDIHPTCVAAHVSAGWKVAE